jgi:hypothetical protein
MVKYRSVVFLDGDNSTEPLTILDDLGEDDLFEYLLRWEYGDSVTESFREPWGSSDWTSVHYDGPLKYVVSWNWNLAYVSLTEVLNG